MLGSANAEPQNTSENASRIALTGRIVLLAPIFIFVHTTILPCAEFTDSAPSRQRKQCAKTGEPFRGRLPQAGEKVSRAKRTRETKTRLKHANETMHHLVLALKTKMARRKRAR
jgi:hypothetical protein